MREGRAVLNTLDRHGVWLRAGMSAIVVGLDLRQALASIPRGCNHDLARELFLAAEADYLAASIAREEERKARNGER